MRNRLSFICLAAVVLASARPSAGQFGFLKGRGDKDLKPFADPAGQFKLSYPKDWQAILTSADVRVVFTQPKAEAALVVERMHLNQPLTGDDITDLFAELEGDTVKQRQPGASDLTAKVVDEVGRRFVTIEYARPGPAGPERVRQYSFPVGADLYRLTCSTVTTQFKKYDPICIQIAASFSVGS